MPPKNRIIVGVQCSVMMVDLCAAFDMGDLEGIRNKLVVEKLSRTKRCYSAPHNYLARLVNLNAAKIRRAL